MNLKIDGNPEWLQSVHHDPLLLHPMLTLMSKILKYILIVHSKEVWLHTMYHVDPPSRDIYKLTLLVESEAPVEPISCDL